LHYSPVDISVSALERSASVLLQTYPTLRITAYAADYQTALRTLAQNTGAKPHAERTLALFLGSNIGNFTRTEAVSFLRDLRGVLRADDALLIGADLRKDTNTLEAAYDDALGITAAFNLNLLVRMNRELGADFNLDSFRHIAVYREDEGRMEMHIESTGAQSVRLAALNLTIEFSSGERIHTENSYKYNLDELDQLAAYTGFARTETWFDEAHQFSSNLFRAVS
jgi:dimethylhistidine N-methyltransferase